MEERLRELADEAWDRGWKDLSADLHTAARRAEEERKRYAARQKENAVKAFN